MVGHWAGGIFFIFLAAGGIYFSRMLSIDQTKEMGSGFFPLLICILLGGLSIFNLLGLFIKGRRFAPPIPWPDGSGWLRMFISLALFLGYYGTLERLGFILATFLLLFLFSRLVFRRPWIKSGILAALSVGISFGLISWLLGVRLPASPWGWA